MNHSSRPPRTKDTSISSKSSKEDSTREPTQSATSQTYYPFSSRSLDGGGLVFTMSSRICYALDLSKDHPLVQGFTREMVSVADLGKTSKPKLLPMSTSLKVISDAVPSPMGFASGVAGSHDPFGALGGSWSKCQRRKGRRGLSKPSTALLGPC